MTNWIECNLPWNCLDYSTAPLNPINADYSDRIRAEFGEIPEELLHRTIGKDLYSSPKYQSYLVASGQVNQIINSSNVVYEDRTVEFDKLMALNSDPSVKEVYNYKKFLDRIWNWKNSLPEYVRSLAEWRIKYNIWEQEQKLKSFTGLGLNKVGTLIEVHSYDGPDETKKYLIGDINEDCGVCGECSEFPNNSIVLRYKVLNLDE